MYYIMNDSEYYYNVTSGEWFKDKSQATIFKVPGEAIILARYIGATMTHIP